MAEKYPDAKYISEDEYDRTTCFYDKGKVANGPQEEGCIFGHALRQNKIHIEPGWLGNIDVLIEESGVEATQEQLDWCKKVQNLQDCGRSWSESVKKADDNYNTK